MVVLVPNENEKMDKEDKMEVDEAKTSKRPSVLDTFNLLRDAGDNFQLDGGVKLIAFLARDQKEENRKYALKRIIRSVGANQLSMRTGYYSTLTVLLSQFQDISVSQLLALVKQELHATSSKGEIGDVSVGQILVCGAVLRSGLFLRATELEQQEVLTLLFSASRKKSYLYSAAYLMLVDFIQALDEDQLKSLLWPKLKSEVKKPIAEQSLDSLYFLMKAHEKFPKAVRVKKLLGVEEIVCEDTIHAICEKLMNVTDLNQTNHPMYRLMGTAMANSEHLKLFWTSGIDSQLTKHNRNRELVAIDLLTTILKNINTMYQVIPDLLTKNFFKLFLDWFKGLQTASKIRRQKDDEDDNKIMVKKGRGLLAALANALKSNDVPSPVKIETLKKLLFNPGDMNLAEITSTPVVKSIMMSLNKEGVKKAAKLFKAVLLNDSKKSVKEGMERAWFNYERLKASEYLSHLVSHPSVMEESVFRLRYMKILMCFGFFKVGGDENVSVSADLSGAIKTSFYRCLNHRLPTVESLVIVLRSLCSFIDEYLLDERIREKLEKQFPEENMQCWLTLKKTCDKIETTSDKTKVDNVFLILLYQLGLFLFSDPKYVELAKGSVNELASCYKHYRNDNKKKRKKLKEGELTEDKPEWIEVLIEVLLSILSCESSVLRGAVQCAFRLLWEYLTPSSIGQIISILDPDSDSNPLMQDSDSESDFDSDVENGSDDKNNGTDEEENEEGSEESGEETEIEDDEQMKIPDQLRMAVHKALGSAANDSDAESVDADMIDEVEGKKLDKALSEAFQILRQGKNKPSKKDRKDKKTLTDFRVRVLDLIDIYLEKEPAMDISLGMLAPLMRCLEFCIQDNQQRELESRVRKTLKLLTSLKKFSSTEDVTQDLLVDYLKATIEKGSRSHFIFQALGDMVTECGAFIVQCSQKIEGQKTPTQKPLVKIYEESIAKFFQNRSCPLPIIFFHKILQLDWEGNYALVPIIIENTFSDTVRQFRRHEGLELLVGFYGALKRLRLEGITKKLQPIELKLERCVEEAFDETNENFVVRDNFFKLLMKLFTAVEKFYHTVERKPSIDLKALSLIIGESKKGMKQKFTKKEKADSLSKQKSEENNTETKAAKIKTNKKKRQNSGGSNAGPKKKKFLSN